MLRKTLISQTHKLFKPSANSLHLARRFSSTAKSEATLDSDEFVEVPPYSRHFTFSAPEQYKGAIENVSTIRFIEFDRKNPRHVRTLENTPEIFVSDSIYRSRLTLGADEIAKRTKNYGGTESRAGGAPFFGTGGCPNFELIERYIYGKYMSGLLFLIDPVNSIDNSRVKLNFNKLHYIATRETNPFLYEYEILHMYLDEEGKLIRNPLPTENHHFMPYVSAIIESKFLADIIAGKRVPNLLSNGKLFDASEWLVKTNELANPSRALPRP